MTAPSNTILVVETGSRAYGLATEESDYDRVGVYIIPLLDYVSPFGRPKETIRTETNDTDYTYHDIGKYVRLAIGGNPNILETLWCPILSCTGYGHYLLLYRDLFLSQRALTSYIGYYTNQRRKLEKGSRLHTTGGKWNPKYACHMIRLLLGARELAANGSMMVEPPDRWKETLMQIKLGEMDQSTCLDLADQLYSEVQQYEKTTCLPEEISEGDRQTIMDLTYRLRLAYKSRRPGNE